MLAHSKDAIPAATVVLLRDHSGELEVLLLRRNPNLDFAPNNWVFPGGRVDPDELAAAADEMHAARQAAAREAKEETGLVVDGASIVVFAKWAPPPTAPRRFSTFFFAARAPEGEVQVDHGEIEEHRWMRPLDAVAARDAGEMAMFPPTWMTLRRLAPFATVDAAVSAFGAQEPHVHETRNVTVDGVMHLLWAGDAGYESSDPTAGGARNRVVLAPDGWRYEGPDFTA